MQDFKTDITSVLAFLDGGRPISKKLKMPRGPPVVLAEGHALKPVLWFPGDSVAAMVDSDLEQVCEITRLGCTQPSPEANPYPMSRRCIVHLSVTRHANAPSCVRPAALLLHACCTPEVVHTQALTLTLVRRVY